MNLIRLIPVILSLLLMAAHFYRAGNISIAAFFLLTPGLLFIPKRWNMRIIQFLLVLSSIEWIRTLVILVDIRQEMGLPWMRLAVILGGVALFTLGSALVFYLRKLRDYYT